jgi:hypothetical protein
MGNLEVRSLPSSVALRFLLDLEHDRVILAGSANLARATRRAEFIEEFGVITLESLPLARDIIFVIDRLDRTYRLTSTTIDTLIWLDVEHPIAFIDAIDWTLLDTGFVLDIDTRFCDDVCHEVIFPS